MDFRILGPLEATGAEGVVALGSRKQRVLLATLLLRANQVVSPDVLIDELWNDRPPQSAPQTLQVYVSRLRAALRAAGTGDDVLVTRPGGYVLRVDVGELDLHRFERLAEDGRRSLAAESFERAAEKLAGALAVWRGRALADLEFEPFARVEIERLEEQRLLVVEDLIEAQLACARHATLVPELGALVAQHPLRERLRGQLMLALYRSGRQADALAAFQDARDRLVEELGLEPTATLRELQQAILCQDASLELRANGGSAAVTAIPAAHASREGRFGRRRVLAALVLCAAASAVLGLVAFGGSRHATRLPPAGVHGNAILTVENGALARQVDVAGRPTALAAGASALWVVDAADDRVLKLDPASGRVEDQVPVGSEPGAIAVTSGAVWVANSGGGTVSRIEPRTGRVVGVVRAGNVPAAIAAGFGAVWVADSTDGMLRRIDQRKNAVVAAIPLGQPLTAVAIGLGSVWVTSAGSGLLVRVDPRSDEPVQTISVGNEPRSLVVAGGAVWIANTADDTLSRVDPETGRVRKLPIARPGALAADGRRIWVAQPGRNDVVAVDVTGRRPPTTLRTGTPVASLAAAAGRLALATLPPAASHRGGTLRVAGGGDLDSVDPGEAWSSIGWQLLSLTNDGLLTYARLPGAAGATVVPDLAISRPTVRDGGRVFTFRLRSGVRYSTGAPVRAQDIRTAIEREYAAGTGLAALGVPILGGDGCTRSRCDLSRGVDVGADQRTVTFRLAAPDASFLYKLALPFGAAVPAGTAAVGAAELKMLPATGPYRIASYAKGREVVLVRNARFRVWSSEAQPAGFPDRIVVRLGLDPYRQAAAVSSGRADATLDTPPAATLARIRASAPLQLHATAAPEVDAVFLNTAAAPFDRLVVREALALAVDRAKIVAITGGPGVARATCQIVPAGFPGYRPACPYTAAPNAAGVWNGPDLARALRLVRQSGTSGTHVTVSTVGSDPRKLAVGRYFVGLLRTLGYRAALRLYPDRHSYYRRVGLARSRSQLGVFDWIADYEAGSTFFRPLFTCASYRPTGDTNLNAASFCHRTIDALIAHATSLEATDSVAANLEWSRVDREITARVPWIPLVNPVAIDYVSRRVDGYQRHPVFGLLLDQVSVR